MLAPKIEIQLIVGLGNPDIGYRNSYHNAGFLALDQIKEYLGASSWKKADGLFEYAKGSNLALVKPLVFMNESGTSVAKAKKYFAVPMEKILVIHDDSDIEVGKFKLDFGKSSAGHNGVQSVIDALRSTQFWRMRIGIRGPRNKKRAVDFVLKGVSPTHKRKLEEVFEKIPGLLRLESRI